MEDTEMEDSSPHKSVEIASALGTLAAVATKLAARSRGIPANTDFHFYNNFPEFKSPARAIPAAAAPAIASVAAAPALRLRTEPFPANCLDHDELLDWVVNLNDELLERFGASMDEFRQKRTNEEASGKKVSSTDQDGFQLVVGKNNKKKNGKEEELTPAPSYPAPGVSVATKDKWTSGTAKSKVPFHIPSIPRPQDEFRILVNNNNVPFQHVWLEKGDDGTFIHPCEKLSVGDFVDKTIGETEPVKPAPLESVPFTFVEELDDLKLMVDKLKAVSEFAVDLEHNQYRSFQGLTCLMQVSTRTEDFIVDTLKLRIFIGSYMRDLFKDPTKRKVMHGSDHDILWLQRDFGIYVCNLFDTGQASRVLQLERNSLEYLLHYFCDVAANKEYQNADWRIRPLPAEMVKYAREDTHYLLYIYDLMRNRLISESTIETDLLLEVYNRSNDICMQMYEKELLTDTSFLNIYGVQQAELNAKQLAVVSGLYQWRDFIARSEDESTGYVLPNKTLIEIAKEMPLSSDKLLRIAKSRHNSYVERFLPSVLDIIRNSISRSHAFEAIAVQLKLSQLEKAKAKEAKKAAESGEQKGAIITEIANVAAPVTLNTNAPEFTPSHSLALNNNNIIIKSNNSNSNNSVVPLTTNPSQPAAVINTAKQGLNVAAAPFNSPSKVINPSLNTNESIQAAKTASVQVMKKPAAAFGALFGKPSSSVKKPSLFTLTSPLVQEESKNKLEKIKQTVALPFSFGGVTKQQPSSNNIFPTNEITIQSSSPLRVSAPPFLPEKLQAQPTKTAPMQDIIPLELEQDEEKDDQETNPSNSDEEQEQEEQVKHREWFPQTGNTNGRTAESDSDSDPDTPTELSSSFEQCFKSVNEMRNNNSLHAQPRRMEIAPSLELKPFDYAAARKELQFGQNGKNDSNENENEIEIEERKKARKNRRADLKKERAEKGEKEKGEKEKGFQPARRRQAFPMSGNRSTTYI